MIYSILKIQIMKERHHAYLFTPEAFDRLIYAEFAAEMEMLCVNVTWTGYRRQRSPYRGLSRLN